MWHEVPWCDKQYFLAEFPSGDFGGNIVFKSLKFMPKEGALQFSDKNADTLNDCDKKYFGSKRPI